MTDYQRLHHNNRRRTTPMKDYKNKIALIGFMTLIVMASNRSRNRLLLRNGKIKQIDEEFLPDKPNVAYHDIKASYGRAEYAPLIDDDWSCAWFPNDHKKCDELFYNRLPPPTPNSEQTESGAIDSQRWLFLGDSTMKRLFDGSALKAVLVQEPMQDGCLGQVTCDEHEADRCELNANFGLPYADQWIAPNPHVFEGPKKFGAENAYCTDCSGCQTHFLECRSNRNVDGSGRSLSKRSECNKGKRRYGGFMTMEFARDTEIQTPEFRTTQENIAAYIGRTWNTPEMLQDWGKPICIIGAGNHDLLLDGITTPDFVQNVKFMLTTMMPVCEHMIWLGNTTNGRKSEYPQTMKQMKGWDRAVKEMLESEPELRGMMSYIEVVDAAYKFPHADFIHMDASWYMQLGQLFVSLM
jgi:hypothetical protein